MSITGRLFQDKNFQYNSLNGLKIEQLFLCKDAKNHDVVLVYLKAENTNWQNYFLDVGIAFWENWEDVDNMEDCEDFIYEDVTKSMELQQQTISKIYAEPDGNNSKIIIELKNQSQLVLQCKHPEINDSNCELIKINL